MADNEFNKCRSAEEGARLVRKGSRAARPSLIPFLLVLLIFVAGTSHAQKADFFNVSSIMRDVKSEFKLNRGDVRRLGPMIENENFDVLMIYVRFGGAEPEYSRAIWRDVISRRTEFESRLDPKLTTTQRSALRSARTALERRVLEFLIQDYLSLVSSILGLDGLELEAMEHLFDKEIQRKHRLVFNNLRKTSFLQSELEKVSLETESWLAKILTPEQLRIYRSIALAEDNLIG
jgi:hypothetical protein